MGKNVKILLLSVNKERHPYPIQPLGALYIVEALKKAGHIVDFLDFNFQSDDGPVLTKLADRPDLICLSIRNIDNTAFPKTKFYLPEIRRVVDLCRSRSDAPFLVGGSGFSMLPKEVLEYLDLTHGIVGQGEQGVVDFIEFLQGNRTLADVRGLCYRDGGTFVENKRDDSRLLMKATCPDREVIDMKRYNLEGGIANIQAKRGCPFDCIYCTYPVIEGKKFILRDPGEIVAEIAYLNKRYGVTYFAFVDSILNIPLGHATAICHEIVKQELKIRWTGFLNPKFLDKTYVELARRSGCSGVELGVDALDDTMLENLKKGFTVGHVEKATKLLMDEGINVCFCLIFAGPGENHRTIAQTFRWLDKLAPTHAVAFGGVRIYPNTEMEEIGKREGYGEDELLLPEFYFSRDVRSDLVTAIGDYKSRHPNFSFEGLQEEIPPEVMRRIRKMGFDGPVWESFSKLR
jgi:radical SAM superfamily enzyme YgiQ (UPF0313 family)